MWLCEVSRLSQLEMFDIIHFASSYPSMLSTTLINTALCITQLARPLFTALFINDHVFVLTVLPRGIRFCDSQPSTNNSTEINY